MCLFLVEGLRRLRDVLRVELRGGAPGAARCPVSGVTPGREASCRRDALHSWEDAAPWWM